MSDDTAQLEAELARLTAKLAARKAAVKAPVAKVKEPKGKADYVIVPKETIISNPAVNYGKVPPPLSRWVGEVLSFEKRYMWGKELPCPWWKEYSVMADNEEMARYMLGKLALREGYALGGVQNIRQEER